MGAYKGRSGRPYRRKKERFKRLSKQAGAPCALCGRAIDYSLEWPDRWSFSVDHIIPVSLLPPDHRLREDLANFQPAHLGCNSSKGNGTDVRSPATPPTPRSASSREW